MKIKVGENEFKVAVADDDEKRVVGLSAVDSMDKGEALLMKFDAPTNIPIRMKDMSFPLDLIYIEGGKVVHKASGKAGQDDIKIKKNFDSVLEVNLGQGGKIKVGDTVDFIGAKNEDGSVTMAEGGVEAKGDRQLLDEDGKNQMNLIGGERIFSRKDTQKFMKYAGTSDFKKLGKAVIEAINRQDSQEPEYSAN